MGTRERVDCYSYRRYKIFSNYIRYLYFRFEIYRTKRRILPVCPLPNLSLQNGLCSVAFDGNISKIRIMRGILMVRYIFLTIFFSSLAINSAEATCTKPIGTYVGGNGGPIIYSGTTISTYAAQIFSVTLSLTGAIVIETGTSTNGGDYSVTNTVSASNITFNTRTCTGEIKFSTNLSAFYASSNSGNTITMIARGGTAGNAYWAPWSTVLNKV